jgi:hypothetical protein
MKDIGEVMYGVRYDGVVRLRVMPPECRLRDSSIRYFVEQDIRTRCSCCCWKQRRKELSVIG